MENAMKKEKDGHIQSGFVLPGVIMLILIASLAGGAFLFSVRGSFAALDQWAARDECLLGVQSGLERRKYAIDQTFRTNYYANRGWDSLDALVLNTDVTEYWTNSYSINPHIVTVRVVSVSSPVSRNINDYTAEVSVTNTASATHRGITRRVREVVRYRYGSAPVVGGSDGSVFDNVFFIDNIGFLSGVNADFNGDVYANKDIDFQYSSIRLQGDSFAAGENLSGKLYKSYDWSQYGSQSFAGISFGDRVRPALHTDFNRSNPNTYWEQGYKEGVSFYDGVEAKDLPFVGPLSEYISYAQAGGGTAGDSTKTVSAVWGLNAGENAGIGTNDTGCLILVGTEADPINLDGVVVATGDIYIKGHYTGQGTLYAGRNIYILDDLVAADPPSWPKPDNNPSATANVNKDKDFLGLAAKGSLFFGDYRELDTSLLKSPHTASHATDASDAELGYVSYYDGGIPYFDGDYTQPDGDGTALRSDGSLRHFYQPMVCDDTMAALGVSARVGWFDAVLYSNHLIAGEFASNAVLNGGLVCRDEAVKRHGNLAFNWDIRIGSMAQDGADFAPWLPGMLPRQTTVLRTIKWTELAP